MPADSQLVCVEVSPSSRPLHTFAHPERAVYLLGAEDDGLPAEVLEIHPVIEVPSDWPLNVATAGSVVLYDRLVKQLGQERLGSVPTEWWTD